MATYPACQYEMFVGKFCPLFPICNSELPSSKVHEGQTCITINFLACDKTKRSVPQLSNAISPVPTCKHKINFTVLQHGLKKKKAVILHLS